MTFQNRLTATVLQAQFRLPGLNLYALFDRVNRNQKEFVRALRAMLGLGLLLLFGLACTSRAQTYTQTAPVGDIGGGTLNFKVPLTPGASNYYQACPTGSLYSCTEFIPTLDGVGHLGHISDVLVDFPTPGQGSGDFSFQWTTNDGLSGTVAGHGHWVAGRFGPHAEIDSSTLVNGKPSAPTASIKPFYPCGIKRLPCKLDGD